MRHRLRIPQQLHRPMHSIQVLWEARKPWPLGHWLVWALQMASGLIHMGKRTLRVASGLTLMRPGQVAPATNGSMGLLSEEQAVFMAIMASQQHNMRKSRHRRHRRNRYNRHSSRLLLRQRQRMLSTRRGRVLSGWTARLGLQLQLHKIWYSSGLTAHPMDVYNSSTTFRRRKYLPMPTLVWMEALVTSMPSGLQRLAPD